MGGGTGTGGLSAETIFNYLSGEEVGGALIYSYAEYLRRVDERPAHFVAEAKMNGAKNELWTDISGYYLNNPDKTEPNPDDIEGYYEAVQRLGRAVLESAYLTARNIHDMDKASSFTDELLKWPVNHRIRVENISDENNVIKRLTGSGSYHMSSYKKPNKRPNTVEGRLVNIDLQPHHQGILVVKNDRGHRYEVKPLIDDIFKFTPSVKVTFLD